MPAGWTSGAVVAPCPGTASRQVGLRLACFLGWVLVISGITGILPGPGLAAAETTGPHAWQRWDHALQSATEYGNPYADVVLRVTYTGPGGRTLRTFGFWDGGQTFRIRGAFPEPGTWQWETECSDPANAGLHRQRGTVRVLPYEGESPLYRRGFLKVGEGRRHLAWGDGTPYLWMGDTAWAVPQRASDEEWEQYLADRVAKRFSLIQVAAAPPGWAGTEDRRGEKPFVDDAQGRWNPAYWRAFERKIQRANERGLIVFVVGLMEPVRRYPASEQACLFARNLAARLFGNFVILSPSFDSRPLPLAHEVGRAIRAATAVHLTTQHPGTGGRNPLPAFALHYVDQSYMDFFAVQSGHNNGDRALCAHHAIEWVRHLYGLEHFKPVINVEGMYDAQGENAWQAVDVRGHGWRSWLSGAMGYTYGAGDVPPKVGHGRGAIWRWVTEPARYDFWEKALQWDSAFQMQYLHDFMAALDWWRLEPAHDLIRDQPDDVIRRRVLAQIPGRDLAVAYLPDEQGIAVDLASFTTPLAARWFDPVLGRSTPVPGVVRNEGVQRFIPPAPGDWVLVLERAK